jgi:hypothetical protein
LFGLSNEFFGKWLQGIAANKGVSPAQFNQDEHKKAAPKGGLAGRARKP